MTVSMQLVPRPVSGTGVGGTADGGTGTGDAGDGLRVQVGDGDWSNVSGDGEVAAVCSA